MKAAVRALLMLAIVAAPAAGAQTPQPAPTPAPAPQAAPPPAPVRAPPSDPMPMDLDGDGVVTAMEHAAGARALFEEMDTNHDERVTREEMLNFQRRVLGAPLPPPTPSQPAPRR